MTLRPLGKAFLFSFANATYGGKFVEKNKGQIILTNQDLEGQATSARWGKVLAVGDKVDAFSVGDIVLIESLQWTIETKFEGTSYWKSDETKVIAIGEDESVTFAY
jgi:co-chaperonin GroES (HSP10)